MLPRCEPNECRAQRELLLCFLPCIYMLMNAPYVPFLLIDAPEKIRKIEIERTRRRLLACDDGSKKTFVQVAIRWLFW